MKKFGIIILAVTILLVLFVGCGGGGGYGGGGGAVVPWAPKPNIVLVSSTAERGLSLTLGVYHDVTYTLYNSGDAEGTVDVEISGDYSGHLLTQTVTVPAHESETKSGVRVDSNERDNDIYVRIIGR